MPTIEAGRVVAGRYRIQEQLGEGGMGSVWRAEHVTLKSPVAVKFLNAAIADHPEMLERFMREAQSAAALRGTYVVQIFDYGVEDGMPYIAMELLNGESLQHRLDRQRVLSVA
jgi:serine/threonine-protein kinase